MVIDTGTKLLKAQCKTGYLRNGVIIFNSCSVITGTTKTVDYRGQIDVFLVHCLQVDGVYLVPVEEVGTRKGYLRIGNTRNNQQRKIMWAKDFLI